MKDIKRLLRRILSIILKPRGKAAFYLKLPSFCKLLDVGCGNNGPRIAKDLLKNSYYVGLDVGNYNQAYSHLADEYIISTPEGFADSLSGLSTDFDAVISNHNLEHCNNREAVLNAMCDRLKVSGKLFLCFPTEKSIRFPSGRNGTLNYYDDSTHIGSPPSLSWVSDQLEAKGLIIEYKMASYKPFFLWLIGAILEPISKVTKRVGPETWAYYGFEAIIIAKKIAD